MITYRATLDVPADTVALVSRWLATHRKTHDRRPWQRAATPYVQAVLVLRWFKDATDLPLLARDAIVSIATAYRYLHEAIDVIAVHAPELTDVPAHGLEVGWALVCLDGTLIASTRCSARSDAGHDVWYSGKHNRHGGNVQVLTGPTGYPEWVSDVEPGSTHDITAARTHALPALYPAAARGLPTLTDQGYTGAGTGIIVPTKGQNLDPDIQARNALISALRAPGSFDEEVIMMRHTDEDIERAAKRFEQLADELDPATTDVDDTDDLRAIAPASDAARAGEARLQEVAEVARARGRSWNHIALTLGVSRQAARQRVGRSETRFP